MNEIEHALKQASYSKVLGKWLKDLEIKSTITLARRFWSCSSIIYLMDAITSSSICLCKFTSFYKVLQWHCLSFYYWHFSTTSLNLSFLAPLFSHALLATSFLVVILVKHRNITNSFATAPCKEQKIHKNPQNTKKMPFT